MLTFSFGVPYLIAVVYTSLPLVQQRKAQKYTFLLLGALISFLCSHVYVRDISTDGGIQIIRNIAKDIAGSIVLKLIFMFIVFMQISHRL